jgi:nucleoid-associated protein YgaU
MRAMFLFCFVTAFLIGCNKPASDLDLTASSATPSSSYTATSSEPTTAGWSADSYGAQTDPSAYGSGSGKVHVVQRKETLYGLARNYYGDASQWKKIYQANQDQITDPNRIKVGMKLVIP